MTTPNKLLVLLCVSIPSFMINLDANIVAVSLTSIARSLHADFAAIEWVVSAYTLTFAMLVLSAGTLADRFGRKRILILGLAVFTLASLICGAAHSSAVLNAARALQGVGAALQLSSALAILAHTFRGAERGRAFAFWGSVIGVAIMLGPVAGGFITQVLGWQWAFYVNLPVGIVMIALTLYAVEESKDPDAKSVDSAGVLTFSGFLGLLTLALISGNRLGWGSGRVIAELLVSVGLLAAFLFVETRQARPMIDLQFFRRPTYIGANIAGVAYAAAFLTMLTYLPIYFQSGLGFSPLTAGLLMLPMAFPLFAVPRVVTLYLDSRLSGRALLTIGLALVGTGLLWTSLEMRGFDYLPILIGMLVASTGAGILNGAIAKVSMTVIPPERAGMASGVSGTVRFSGVVVGFAALGAVLFARVGSSLASGLPQQSAAARFALTREIANGNLAGAAAAMGTHEDALALVRESFGQGYQAVLTSAGVLAAIACVLSWLLIRSAETAPHPASCGESGFAIPVD
jgi:EmrB/QacA subfamily drug resistance transporter